MANSLTRLSRLTLLCIIGGALLSVAFAQAPRTAAPSSHAATGAETVSSNTITHASQFPHRSTRRHSPYSSLAISYRARDYYRLVWGVDLLSAKLGESGQIVRFSYRILDPQKAKVLNEKKFNPVLIDEAAHVKLIVPSLEKVGELRQSGTPEEGRIYWMAFSNRGGPVKRGDRVSIVIDKFRADGLTVE
jgi:hypothetical protein